MAKKQNMAGQIKSMQATQVEAAKKLPKPQDSSYGKFKQTLKAFKALKNTL